MRTTTIILLAVVLSLFGCEKEGLDGLNSLVKIIVETEGENCASGGFKIVSGVDLNKNGILDEDEVQHAEFICNGDHGNDGLNSLVNVLPESPGENCTSGGYKIVSGIDLNNNGSLDESEIQNAKYICHGDDGNIYLDNLIRLTMLAGHTALSTDWVLNTNLVYVLPDFNKEDYANVDSIVFVATLETRNSNNKCIAELYNITDDTPILNSQVETNSTIPSNHYSKNIYSSLPSKKINLGIRVRSEKDGVEVIAWRAYIYILRN